MIKIYLIFIFFFTSCAYFADSKSHDFYRAMEEGSSCSEGAVRSGYENPSAINGQCRLVTQTCVNGVFIGPRLYPTCEKISKDCGTLQNGQSFTGFISKSAPCIKETHKCQDGLIKGPLKLYKSCK